MKKVVYFICAAICVATLLFSLTVGAGADFGDFGGDADYGGGDYGGSDWDYDDDYDYSGGSIISFGSLSTPAGIIIVAAVVVFILIAKKKAGGVSSGPRVSNFTVNPTSRANLNDMSTYVNVDPSFSGEDLKEWVSNSYVRLQKAWQAKDLSPVQTLLSDAFYAQMNSQLSNYKNNRKTNVIDKIAVFGVTLLGWKQDAGCDVIIAEVRTRITDYVVDDDTGKVISGNPNAEKFMEYEWTLSRTSGATTERTSGVKASNCPNCGAPIDLNKSAICPYCDSVIKTEQHGWVLSAIKAISQKTV